MQHEVGVRNLEILNNSTDAKGRKLEVFKVHVPPPLFRKYKEAEGVHVSLQSTPALLSLPLGVCYNVTLPNTLIFQPNMLMLNITYSCTVHPSWRDIQCNIWVMDTFLRQYWVHKRIPEISPETSTGQLM